ncbi:MAG: IS110 family transposase [Egibacteraceae bacterium]
MRYLGMDVHAASTVWCLVDAHGEVVNEGRASTTVAGLTTLLRELGPADELLAGQEVGTLTYLVHDAVTATGTTLLSFNAAQLRMIAASRKKTDRRDAYWIAKALQAGMYPHPVYIPTGEIRELRALLSQRRVLHADYNRWRYRARTYLRAGGYPVATGVAAVRAALAPGSALTRGAPASLTAALALCQRQEAALRTELAQLDAAVRARTQSVDAIQRLMTVPGIGPLTATMLYAWVGDIRRFPHAKQLAAYAGLVPTVRQSGNTVQLGRITKQGTPALRATVVQAAHVLLSRCRGPEATPLQAIGLRIRGTRGRRKIAVVAVARHLVRLAFYILRDGTTYDAGRVGTMTPAA